MRFMSALALGVLVPVGAAVTLAAPAQAAKKDEAPAAPQLKPSPNFVKVYQEIDKALKAGDVAGAKAKLPDAEKAASNADDKYLYGNLVLNIGITSKDEAMQNTGLQTMVASGKASPADTAKFSFFLGQFASNAKQTDTAIKYFNDAAAGGYGGPSPYVMIAELNFSKAAENIQGGQFTPAGKTVAQQGVVALKKAVDLQAASGQPVDKRWYARGFQMAAASDSPDVGYWGAAALKSDPSPENWRVTLRMYQDSHRTLTRDENLDLFRLMSQTGALKDNYSYSEYADDALRGGLPGEAKAVIDKGRASGALSATQLADYYKAATDSIAKDKASLPASEASAAKAADGRIAASTASAYLGYGDYAKAVQLYRLALQKGGVDADEANTRLGIALLQSGDKAGAKAAFGAVKAGNRKDIAGYWNLYIDLKGA